MNWLVGDGGCDKMKREVIGRHGMYEQGMVRKHTSRYATNEMEARDRSGTLVFGRQRS